MERPHRKARVPAYLPTALCAAAILWLTLAPHPLGEDPVGIPLFPHADKAVHAAMFLALTATALFDRRRQTGRPPGAGRAWATALAAMLLGAAIEVAQLLMGLGRGFELLDIAADAAGAAAAVPLWLAFTKKRH